MNKKIIILMLGCLISNASFASTSYIFRYNMPGVNVSEEGFVSEENRKTAWKEFFDNNQNNFYKPRDDSFNQIVMKGNNITGFPDENYPLSEISGSIAFFQSNVTNVDPFTSLKIVHGSLGFNDSQLNNIDGFRNVQQVDDYITVSRNKLTDIDGFSSLKKAGSYINFEGNNIKNINGLRNLIEVKRFLRGYSNKITNLDALERLEYVGEEIEFQNNNLISIYGLRSLKYVGSRIDLYGNPNLKDISALSNIDFVGGPIRIDKNINQREGFKGIDANSWLCQPSQKNRFDSNFATQKDLCL